MPTTVQPTRTTVDAGVELRTYRDKLLPGIVRFWNHRFKDRRNFFKLSLDAFRERIIEKNYIEEPFDPKGMILAVDRRRGEVVGMIHCGVRSERFCGVVYPGWPGGSEAYIGMLAVAETHKRRGIGAALWNAAEQYAQERGHSAAMVIDSTCLNPCYGNSDGLYAPPWGTTEGMALGWDDDATLRFLERRGHKPRARAISMELPLQRFRPFPSGAEKLLAHRGLSLVWTPNRSPGIGGKIDDALVKGEGDACGAMCCVDRERVVGLAAVYPMAQVDPAKAAIYDFETLADYRGLGIGKAVLWKLFAQLCDAGLETCEVLTIPSSSCMAYLLYRQAGALPVADWAIY